MCQHSLLVSRTRHSRRGRNPEHPISLLQPSPVLSNQGRASLSRDRNQLSASIPLECAQRGKLGGLCRQRMQPIRLPYSHVIEHELRASAWSSRFVVYLWCPSGAWIHNLSNQTHGVAAHTAGAVQGAIAPAPVWSSTRDPSQGDFESTHCEFKGTISLPKSHGIAPRIPQRTKKAADQTNSSFRVSEPYGWQSAGERTQSHFSEPPAWYSVTRVSKKFFSFERSMVSLIHGNGLEERNCVGRPIRSRRRSAMYCT